MCRVTNYIPKAYEKKPAFLIEYDNKQFISCGCVYEEVTLTNINQAISIHGEEVRHIIDKLLSTKKDYCLAESGEIDNMSHMFYNATNFNQPIGNWDTSNVTDIRCMFLDATNFNQPIGNWDTSSVTDMGCMFLNATNFNQDIGNWDIRNINDMSRMFYNATNFKQNISNWDISNVDNIRYMFDKCNIKEKYKPKGV